jgi:hypothetical protein
MIDALTWEYAYRLYDFIQRKEEEDTVLAAYAKGHARHWYPYAYDFAVYLSETYGVHIDKCIGITSAMSIRQRWKRNRYNAEQFIRWYMGLDDEAPRCFDICIDKCEHIMMLPDTFTWSDVLYVLNGQKITSFADVIRHRNRSLMIVIDSIMAQVFGLFTRKDKKKKISTKHYAAMCDAVRIVADSLGWAYAELQAYVWILKRGRAY